MRSQRQANPLFSSLGCSTVILFLIGLTAVIYWRGGQPFSPGELTAVQTQNITLGGVTSHAELESDCGQCHSAWRGVSADLCQDCHTNIAEQRADQTGLHGRFQNSADCQTCHTEHQGREANLTQISLDTFDHDRLTNFSLAKHQRDYQNNPIACRDCHQTPTYDVAAIDCATCHTTAEPTFMADHTTLFGDDCLACHDGVDSMVGFDHDQVFVLDGAHTAVTCTACHLDREFSGLSSDCAACHAEPEIHFGQFGTDCARCHTTSAWSPAQLTQHTFPLDHGQDRNNPSDCLTCHVETYATYTCYNCHEHNPADIREEHLEEGIRDFENCVECHPTGREDEAEQHNRREDD